MEWKNDLVLSLIAEYRGHECLWNPVNKDYKNKIKKKDAWAEISHKFNCDESEVRKKVDSLLSSFRRERQKETQTKRTGSAADMPYKSTWFAYSSMRFLLDKYVPRRTMNTEDLSGEKNDSENGRRSNDEDDPEPVSTESSAVEGSSADEGSLAIEGEVEVPPRRKLFRSPKKPNLPKSHHSRADEAYSILQDAVQKRNMPRDESTIYGEHIAAKHRKYSPHTRSVIEHLIGNILFDADMGRYEERDRYFKNNSPAPSLLNDTPLSSPSTSTTNSTFNHVFNSVNSAPAVHSFAENNVSISETSLLTHSISDTSSDTNSSLQKLAQYLSNFSDEDSPPLKM